MNRELAELFKDELLRRFPGMSNRWITKITHQLVQFFYDMKGAQLGSPNIEIWVTIYISSVDLYTDIIL